MVINYWAVLVAAIGAFAVGAVWYSALFGKKWRALMHFDTMPAGGMPMQQAMIGGFLATLVMVYVLAAILAGLGAFDVTSALMYAFWLWLGFIATTMISSVFYERRSWTLYFINVFHYFFALAVAAIILGLWQ